VPVPAQGTFHYSIPDTLQGRLAVGQAVSVPFGRRRMTGYILDLLDEVPSDRPLKDLLGLVGPEALFPIDLISLYQWMARYYSHPLGEVVRTALPGATRSATRGVVRLLPGGKQRAESSDSDEPLERLLRRLSKSPAGCLAVSTVLREEGWTRSLIRRATEQDLVETAQSASRSAMAARSEELFALSGTARATRDAFPRPGPVRDRLIDYIERFGPVTRSELRDAFPSPGGPLQQLRTRGLLEVSERIVPPGAAERVEIDPADVEPRVPNPEQKAALDELVEAAAARRYAPFLLHGVTGSGKTEVYLQLAARVLEDGGTALLLVPEIGLTPQFLARFRARFGERKVAVLHSGLTERERFDEWLRIRSGEASLVVGPRSAVFAPVENLRLIVVDEEHDGSYKQEEGLRYNARDVALVRAQRAEAVVVLGSATPSLESLHNAREGRYRLLSLPSRVSGRSLPEVELVDLREHPVSDPEAPAACLSPPMREALQSNWEDGGQAILLLNRRGFATTVVCTSCGNHFRCSECDVSLTYHGRSHQLTCHWCGRSSPLPDACPSCRDRNSLNLVGHGTERLEEGMLALWPSMRIDRMDGDTTRSRSSHRRILGRFRRREVDVLVGTQMVAKGHDFPGVTLVGVLHADSALHMPDFRASERTFQLVSQVAGRAGRGERPGRVLVQTWHPQHHAIRFARDHDFDSFAERELRLRKGLWYAPFARLVMFRVSAQQERCGQRAAMLCRDRVEAAARDVVTAAGQLRVLGPSPSPVYRARGRYRWQVMVKACDHRTLGRLLEQLAPALVEAVKKEGGGVRLVIDRDPVSML
jgi:primosomal protein N' (replication factor Y)